MWVLKKYMSTMTSSIIQCLNVADIDQPLSNNNAISMVLDDHRGTYDGTWTLEYIREMEYNEHGLPFEIVTAGVSFFNTFRSTITINYSE